MIDYIPKFHLDAIIYPCSNSKYTLLEKWSHSPSPEEASSSCMFSFSKMHESKQNMDTQSEYTTHVQKSLCLYVIIKPIFVHLRVQPSICHTPGRLTPYYHSHPQIHAALQSLCNGSQGFPQGDYVVLCLCVLWKSFNRDLDRSVGFCSGNALGLVRTVRQIPRPLGLVIETSCSHAPSYIVATNPSSKTRLTL